MCIRDRIRHGHPSRALRVIAVAGEYGASTTALLIGEILEEARWPTMVLTPVKSHLSGAEAVSDTHLDVYKRQPKTLWLLSGFDFANFCKPSNQLCVFSDQRIFLCIDVYKRQIVKT